MKLSIKSKHGFSLVEATISLGLLVGLSALGYSIYRNSYLASKTLSQNNYYRTSAEASLNTLKKVLSPSDSFNQGICKFMTSRVAAQGIGRIEFNFPKISSTTDVLLSDWDSVFKTNEWVPSPKCSPSTYSKCYSPTTSNTIIDSKLSSKVYFKFSISPIYTRTSDSGAFKPLDLSDDVTANARDVSFYLTSSVYDVKDSSNALFAMNTVVWPGQYKCMKNGLTLLVSSIGSSYEGTTPLFSDTSEIADEARSKIHRNYGKIVDLRYIPEVRLGSKIENGIIRSTDDFATFSCSQRRFRCGNNNDNFEDNLMARGNIKMLTNNGLTVGNTLKVSTDAYFKGRDGEILNPGTFRTSFRGSAPVFDETGKPQMTINNEQNTFGIQFTNVGTQCANVCANSLGPTPKKYSTVLKFILRDYQNYETEVADERDLSCTCCFTKQCARFGVSNYGVCSAKPSEPLDSRIPECAISGGQYSDLMLTSTTSSDGCLFIKKRSGNLVISSGACGEDRKFLCYASGSFMFAKEDAATDIVDDFKKGRESCYKLGFTKMNKSDYDNFLNQMNTYSSSVMRDVPTSGDSYEFINAATAGLFISPFTAKQMEEVNSFLQDGQEAWIGHRGFGDNRTMAEPPIVDFSTSSFLSYNLGAIHYFARDNLPDFGVGNRGIFHHSRRSLGVFWGQDRTYRPICIDANGDVSLASASASSFDNAFDICLNESKAFVPPINTSQWMKAAYLMNPPDEFLPWGIEASGAPRSVSSYVSLIRDSSPLGWKSGVFQTTNNYFDTFLKSGLRSPNQPTIVRAGLLSPNAKICKESGAGKDDPSEYRIVRISHSCSPVAYVDNFPEKIVCKDLTIQNYFQSSCDPLENAIDEGLKYELMLKLLGSFISKTDGLAFRKLDDHLLTGFNEDLYK